MSTRYMQVIRKKEREGFQKIKEIEHQKQCSYPLQDILYTSDFTFTFFSSKGDSGEILLATSKTDPKVQYLVKHAFYDCACNEYIYSKIGNKMGISIAPVQFFWNNDKNPIFASDFLCGITFFDSGKTISYQKLMEEKDEIINWQDYFKMKGLEILFDEGDGIEIIKQKNKIYRIDTTDSFAISHLDIANLVYHFYLGDFTSSEAKENLLKRTFANKTRRNYWKFGMNTFLSYYSVEYLSLFLEPFFLMKKITLKEIQEWNRVVTFFYPNLIGEYFQSYFMNIKKDVEIFLQEMACEFPQLKKYFVTNDTN